MSFPSRKRPTGRTWRRPLVKLVSRANFQKKFVAGIYPLAMRAWNHLTWQMFVVVQRATNYQMFSQHFKRCGVKEDWQRKIRSSSTRERLWGKPWWWRNLTAKKETSSRFRRRRRKKSCWQLYWQNSMVSGGTHKLPSRSWWWRCACKSQGGSTSTRPSKDSSWTVPSSESQCISLIWELVTRESRRDDNSQADKDCMRCGKRTHCSLLSTNDFNKGKRRAKAKWALWVTSKVCRWMMKGFSTRDKAILYPNRDMP